MRTVFTACLLILSASFLQAEGLKISTFQVSATPPLGSPVAYKPARKIEDPLSARGIVLLGAGEPIVLCAVDWLGIANEGYTLWIEKLATAAGTTPERVSVHCLHQHDAPRADLTSAAILAEYKVKEPRFDENFIRTVVENTARAIKNSLEDAQSVTHLGVGIGKVEKVASNRRILGPDGKVKIVRYSKTKNPEAIAAPEGVIDPLLKLVSFWNGDTPLVSLTYYATHPQSYYGQGDVTAEFVGMARAQREAALPKIAHIHFNGASGNVAAGKYNDGSTKMRPILADRLAAGMKLAWENTTKTPISATDVEWRTVKVSLPVGKHLIEADHRKVLANPNSSATEKLTAAKHLSWLLRTKAGFQITLSALRLKNVSIVHMPGELFIEYQLAAQKLRPDQTVCMAAYGEYGCGYIGTEIAYGQGGYETSNRASRVAPAVEKVLMDALHKLLKKSS